jgi:DNA-binding transcriptional LysR family regulator
MRRQMSDDELRAAIRDHGQRARDASQVARRLKELLPRRVAPIDPAEISEGRGKADLRREALVDSQYIQRLEEWLEIAFDAHRERVEYETHFMLWEARRSIRAWKRPW